VSLLKKPATQIANSWVAIDFETASSRGTPCAVGLAEVENGRVVASHSRLIRPPIFEFWPFNVALHGITPQMCERAPSWEASLKEILEIVAGRPVVAHNAGFDLGVVRDACDSCGLEWPELSYACTLVVSRRIWPTLSSHSLPFVAAHLGLDAESHHDAEADATLAALIGLAALEATEALTLQELLDRFHVAMGAVERNSWRGCQGRDRRAPLPTEPTPGSQPRPEHPLYGKSVAFTGALAIPRREAQQAVVDRGGLATRGVTQETAILVTGFQDLTKLAVGATKSSKLRKAETLRTGGQPIEIVTESEFVRLLSDVDSQASGGVRTTQHERVPPE
jgi:DNA polymerase III epsilon subunit-like protein